MSKRDEDIFKDELAERFEEEFEGILDENGDIVLDYEPPQYWQDTISDIADQAVPIYTEEMYELWMALGRPEDEDGLAGNTRDIDKIVAAAIYQYATAALYEMAHDKYHFPY